MRDLRGTRRKRARVAEHLGALPEDALPLAAVYWSGRPFPRAEERTLNVGWATLREAALAVLPWDAVVWSASHEAVGDTGETLGKLLEASPAKRAGQSRLAAFGAAEAPFSLHDAAATFGALARARDAAEKRRLLEQAWRRLSPVEAKVFTKIATGGLRIGAQEALVEEAVAEAFGRDVADVRLANMLTGDLGEAARLARADRLDEARFRLFHPLQFMLAAPLDPDEPRVDDLAAYAVEDKYDGVRAQLHKEGDRAVLYTRTLDVAREFPEIEVAARRVPGAFVLDGEVVAWKGGRALPFAHLQRRLGRKAVDRALREEVPVRFVAYDVLFLDGEETWRLPFEERRRRLDGLELDGPLAVSPLGDAESEGDLEREFAAARRRGNEGLMLKRRDAPYEFGKRGRRWLKLKTAFATLDVVVTAAESGHGKRAGLLSDYTFAVRGPDGRFLNVGKAYTGLTDEEIRRLTNRFRRSTVERFGSVHVVRPEVVLEVAFDAVQASPRHRSGYALRFPRIVRIRDDKRPEDIDTLERVEDLARLSLGDEAPPSARRA